MRSRVNIAIFIVIALSILTIVIAFYYYRQFPALAVVVEDSPGTWLSGVLLSCGAGVALVLSILRGWKPWSLTTVFLFLLAADEHFMLHERAKQWIAFNIDNQTLFIRELPVFIGAVAGGWIAWMLWRELIGFGKVLLLIAVFAGVISVTLDVIATDAMWEELMKLVAELGLVCALVVMVGRVQVG
jgi:hypothetical protein